MTLTLNCVPHPCREGLDEALVELLAANGVTA